MYPLPPRLQDLQAPAGEHEAGLGPLVGVGDGADPDGSGESGEFLYQTVGYVHLDPDHAPTSPLDMGDLGGVAVYTAVLAASVWVEGVLYPRETGGGEGAPA